MERPGPACLADFLVYVQGPRGTGSVGFLRWVPSMTSFTEEEKLQDLTYCHCPMDSAHLVTFNRVPGCRAGVLLDGF